MAKTCNKCGQSKKESEFFKDSTKPDGYHIYCKSCDYIRKQKYRRLSWQDRLDKKISAVKKKKENSKEYRTQNRESCIAATKSWYEKNKEHCKLRDRNYRVKNKDKLAAAASLRRAKIKGAGLNLSKPYKVEIEGLYLFAKVFGGHVDHIVPLNNNIVCGLHVPWNMQVISPTENMSKQGKFDVEKYPEQGIIAFG
jgi:hypothetical protein